MAQGSSRAAPGAAGAPRAGQGCGASVYTHGPGLGEALGLCPLLPCCQMAEPWALQSRRGRGHAPAHTGPGDAACTAALLRLKPLGGCSVSRGSDPLHPTRAPASPQPQPALPAFTLLDTLHSWGPATTECTQGHPTLVPQMSPPQRCSLPQRLLQPRCPLSPASAAPPPASCRWPRLSPPRVPPGSARRMRPSWKHTPATLP